jgi:hypothetical protein
MKIRHKQQQALQLAKTRESLGRIALALRDSLPDETARYSEEELNRLCRDAVTNGKRYGLVSERSVYVYAACMILFGTDFDTDESFPWTEEVLPSDQTDESSKRNLLEIHVLRDAHRDI